MNPAETVTAAVGKTGRTATDGLSVEIDVDVRDEGWHAALPQAMALCRGAATAALDAALPAGLAGSAAIEIGIVLADDATVHALNRDWRGMDAPTNVLAFPGETVPAAAGPAADRPVMLGDVIVASGVVQEEAARDGKTLADHLTHLVIHGTLHLLGHDHETQREAAVMEGLETRILGGFGIADPYAEDRDDG